MSIQIRRYTSDKNGPGYVERMGQNSTIDPGQPAILNMVTDSDHRYDNTLVVRNNSTGVGIYPSSENAAADSDDYCEVISSAFRPCIVSGTYGTVTGTGNSGSSAILELKGSLLSTSALVDNPDSLDDYMVTDLVAQNNNTIYVGCGAISHSQWITAYASKMLLGMHCIKSGDIGYINISGLPNAKTAQSDIGYCSIAVTGADDSTISYARSLINMRLAVNPTANNCILLSSSGSTKPTTRTIPASWVDSDPQSDQLAEPSMYLFFHKTSLSVTPTSYSTISSLFSAVMKAITDFIGNTTPSTMLASLQKYAVSYESDAEYYLKSGLPFSTDPTYAPKYIPFSSITNVPDTIPVRWDRIVNMPRWAVGLGYAQSINNEDFVVPELGKFTANVSNCTIDRDDREAFYYKLGQLVYIACYLHISSDSTSGGSGNYTLSGFPFSFNPYPFNNLANGSFNIKVYDDVSYSTSFSSSGMAFKSPYTAGNLTDKYVSITGWYMTNEE